MKVLIPARGGSKGIPNKNLIDINGNPLIFYTINEALKVFDSHSIYVSSDSDKILSYVKKFGINTIKRPKSLSGDNSTSSQVINHFIESIDEKGEYKIIYLQPTSPLRKAKHIKDSINVFESKKCNSLISVSKSNEYIDKTFTLTNGYIEPFLGISRYNEIRQDAIKTYYPNGAIYIFTSQSFLKNNKIPIDHVIPFIMRRVDSIDIDDNIDLEYVRIILKKENE